MVRYVQHTGSLPFFSVPQTYNQKYLWRKFIDHDPRFITLSDKLACKTWVAEKVPDLLMAEVLWSSSEPREVFSLPDSILNQPLVFKSNHSNGDTKVLRNGVTDRQALYSDGVQMLAHSHYLWNHEWAYYGITRKLFIERPIGDSADELSELKLYTFGPKVVRIVHIGGRSDAMWANAWQFDEAGKLVRSSEKAALAEPRSDIDLPPSAERAIRIAGVLGADFDHLRIDLFWDGSELWLGEVTVYNQAGYHKHPSGNDRDSMFSLEWDITRSRFLQRSDLQGIKKWYARALRAAM